jgi:hypothetical protein
MSLTFLAISISKRAIDRLRAPFGLGQWSGGSLEFLSPRPPPGIE